MAWDLLNISLAQEGGLTAANPTQMNQWVLHSCDRYFCNSMKLTPPESVLMFIWKPFAPREVLFFSVDRAINSYINIYLERKVFSLYQFSFVFSSTHWLQKNIPLFLQFSNWRGKGTPCYFAKKSTFTAMVELRSTFSYCWRLWCSSSRAAPAALQQSASTYQQRSKSPSQD